MTNSFCDYLKIYHINNIHKNINIKGKNYETNLSENNQN